MQVEFRTDRGRIRQHNEDNGGVFQNKNGISIVIVADGMGGHQPVISLAKWRSTH